MSVTLTDNSAGTLSSIDSAILRALETIGGKGETYAKYLCPVRTGNLRNSITHQTDADEKAAVIGTNVEYAPYVELGTVKQKAQPYLRPAIEDHIAEYQSVLEQELRQAQ